MRSIYLLILVNLLHFNYIFGEANQQKLAENGVAIIDKSVSYTEHQYYLLSSFDFDSYRNFSSKRTVQIEDGPLVELLSLSDMQLAGKQIPAELVEQKKGEISSDHLKKVITLINIGFKYPPIKNTETGF